MKTSFRIGLHLARLGIASSATLMAGCAAPPPSQSLLLVRGSAEVAGEGPAWCYATLADPDCYVAPDEAARERLIGAYIPIDQAPAPTPAQP
jgi:hypothetical protein